MPLTTVLHRTAVAAAATAAALLSAATLTDGAAASGWLAQASQTAIAKVQSFGLVPDPQPFVPSHLEVVRFPVEGGRGVIGLGDDRTAMTSANYPWSTIGRLQNITEDGYLGICTGTLVAPDVVLTNAHCVVNVKTHQVKPNLTFHPNMRQGQVAHPSHVARVVDVIYGTDFRDSDRVPHPDDWAFAQLDRPLGDTYGTLAWTSLAVADLARDHQGRLIMAGYSHDFPAEDGGNTAGVHDGCTVLGEIGGSLIHDCDSAGGSSGGPMLAIIDNQFRIVGLNSAERNEVSTNTSTGEVIRRQGIVNYGVQIAPILTVIRQAQ